MTSEKETLERKKESRQLLQRELDVAYGLYIQQEPTRGDEWRDVSFWQLLQHLRHEIKEIQNSKTSEKQYHNALDACSLAALLAAKIKELESTGSGVK